MAENAKVSKLVSIFNTLSDDEKDIVITMGESLKEKTGNEKNKAETSCALYEETNEEIV
jgi:hypothetical protein